MIFDRPTFKSFATLTLIIHVFFLLLSTLLLHSFFIIFFFFLIHERHRERERQRYMQREKQAPCREPDMGFDPRSPGSGPGLKAAPNPWATRAAPISVFKSNWEKKKSNWERRESIREYSHVFHVGVCFVNTCSVTKPTYACVCTGVFVCLCIHVHVCMCVLIHSTMYFSLWISV